MKLLLVLVISIALLFWLLFTTASIMALKNWIAFSALGANQPVLVQMTPVAVIVLLINLSLIIKLLKNKSKFVKLIKRLLTSHQPSEKASER